MIKLIIKETELFDLNRIVKVNINEGRKNSPCQKKMDKANGEKRRRRRQFAKR